MRAPLALRDILPRMKRSLAIALTSALAVVGAASPARADAPRFAAGVGTDAPVSVGVRGDVELPYRLRASTSLGFLPAPYVDGMNALLVGLGAYPQATGNLIKSAIRSSLAWRTHVGVRPFPKLGLYGDVGYGLITLGGEATAAEILEGVTGKSLNVSRLEAASRTFDASSTLHMLDVEIGYLFPVSEHFVLRTALGGAFTLASSTTITSRYTPAAPRLVEEFTSYAETYLDDTFTSYVFTPTVGVGFAYVF